MYLQYRSWYLCSADRPDLLAFASPDRDELDRVPLLRRPRGLSAVEQGAEEEGSHGSAG
jgi:hypothetical protein